MKYLRHFINESSLNDNYDNSFIQNICIAMVLINNTFLDDLLDRGIINRYTKDSTVFINDLHMIITNPKSRIKLENVNDTNKLFNDSRVKFNIQTYWNKLIQSRDIARNIIDKIIPDDKLTSDMIDNIIINNDKYYDFTIKTKDGREYFIITSKKFAISKSKSLNTVIDSILTDSKEKLFSDIYLEKWNKIAQEWVRLNYQYANNKFRMIIEKFINPDRISSVTYSNLFDIKIKDENLKILGLHVPEFDKHYVYLSELLSSMYNDSKVYTDFNKISEEWNNIKKYNLNSKILQDFFENNLPFNDDSPKLDDNFIMANKDVKMKLMKMFIEIVGFTEEDYHFFTKNTYHKMVGRPFFRTNYDNFDIFYDTHNELVDNNKNDYNLKIKINYNREYITGINIKVAFSGGEMSGKLTCKYTLDIPSYFNYKLK